MAPSLPLRWGPALFPLLGLINRLREHLAVVTRAQGHAILVYKPRLETAGCGVPAGSVSPRAPHFPAQAGESGPTARTCVSRSRRHSRVTPCNRDTAQFSEEPGGTHLAGLWGPSRSRGRCAHGGLTRRTCRLTRPGLTSGAEGPLSEHAGRRRPRLSKHRSSTLFAGTPEGA